MNELTSKLKIKLHIKSISTLVIWNNIKIPKTIEIVRYHPILTDITRSRPILPDITRSHPIPLDITRSHPISPDLTRYHPILPDFIRFCPNFSVLTRSSDLPSFEQNCTLLIYYLLVEYI